MKSFRCKRLISTPDTKFWIWKKMFLKSCWNLSIFQRLIIYFIYITFLSNWILFSIFCLIMLHFDYVHVPSSLNITLIWFQMLGEHKNKHFRRMFFIDCLPLPYRESEKTKRKCCRDFLPHSTKLIWRYFIKIIKKSFSNEPSRYSLSQKISYLSFHTKKIYVFKVKFILIQSDMCGHYSEVLL